MTVEGAATAVYTTYTKVIALFPATPPTSLTQAVVNTAIADASRQFDAQAVKHIDFPDIAASPATPPIVEMGTRYLTFWNLSGVVAALNRTKPDSTAMFYKGEYDRIVAGLNDGSIVIPRQSVASESVTFGSGAAGDLMTTEAKLAKRNVIAETLRIVTPSTETEYDRDYRIYYSAEHRCWVYWGLSSLGQAATVVGYEYDYAMRHEIRTSQTWCGSLERA